MSTAPNPDVHFEREKWLAQIEFEREKWRSEIELKRAEARFSRWTNPIALAILGATATGLVTAGLNSLNNRYQLDLEDKRGQATLKLEENKAEATRILEATKAPTLEQAGDNLNFLVQAGLVAEGSLAVKLRAYISDRKRGTGPLLSTQSAQSTETTQPTLYMVVISSSKDEASAKKAGDVANKRFHDKPVDLQAEVLAPPEGSLWWGVFVGEWIPIGEALAKLKLARDNGYPDAYVTKG
jgi:hypothetical protein